MGEEDDKRINGDGVLENGNGIGDVSGPDSGANTGDEANSEHINGKEIINENEIRGFEGGAMSTLPGGCNVFYGTYIDNYNGNRRTRYYLDSYGQLIPSTITTSNSRPTGSQCMTEMPMSHNMDMGIVVAEAGAAIAIWLAVKFVVGRLIK